MFALKDVTELPAHRGLVCGLRLAKSRRCAAVARMHARCGSRRGKTPAVSPLLRINPFPFRTRCARKNRVPPRGCHLFASRAWRGVGATPEWVQRLPVGGAQCACVLAVQSRRVGSRRWTGSSRRCDTGRVKGEKKVGALRQPFPLFLCVIPYTCRSSAIPGPYPARSVRRSRAAGLRPGGPWRRCPTRSPDGWCGSRRSARAA